jgi:hypothetical protein
MLRVFLASFVAIGFLAAVPALAADETYTLKLYKSKKGDKSEHEKTESGKTDVIANIGGTEKKEELLSGKKESYTEEILEKKDGDRLATKLTRKYTVAEKTEKGETTKAVYAGKTVLIEKKDGKYEFSIDGQALKESDAPDLFKSFSDKKAEEPKNEDFLPDGPVKVGDSWKVSADKSAKMFKSLGEEKMKIDAKKSAIEGKLLKVYKKGDVQCGVIELVITVFVTELDLGGQFVKTTADSKMAFTFTIDTCIDGTVEFENGKLGATFNITADIPDVGSIVIKGTIAGTEKVSTKK